MLDSKDKTGRVITGEGSPTAYGVLGSAYVIWLYPPEIFDIQTQQVIFRVRDIAWTLDHSEWKGDSVLSISLRKYPDAETRLNVRINCADKTAKIGNEEEIALKALGEALEKTHTALAAALNANPPA